MKRIALLVGLSVVTGALAASSARASIVTIGSDLTATPTTYFSCTPTCTFSQAALPGRQVTSPLNGTVVLWRVNGNNLPLTFRVIHPSGSSFVGAGSSTAPTVGFGIKAFSARLPIHAGDYIGLDQTADSAVTFHDYAGDTTHPYNRWMPVLADGKTGTPATGNGDELLLNADIQPQPGVASLSPASGSIKGGTSVTITGHDFTGITVVSFGALGAASFTVNSDTQITAVSPPSSVTGPVDLRVTATGGTSPAVAGDKFTYMGCVVPRLTGKTLKKARRRLRANDCRLGKVTGARSGKVRRQRPKPGRVLAPGSKVTVTLR